MAITKILAKHARLDVLIRYAIDGDKTEDRVLTAYQNCTEKNAYLRMMQTKSEVGKKDGIQAYHIIQSFAEDEVTPEQALQIACKYVRQCIPDYEAAIGVHVNTGHIHAHIVFNSVNLYTGAKYHSNTKSYYQQIRGISDQICREHGLKIIMTGEKSHSVSYYEWLREKRGQPTYRSMLEADMRWAMEEANDYGHFLVLMEHMGYEIKHGSRLSFRLRGCEHWIVPGRKNPLFTEDGIRQAIQGNFESIEAGLRPVLTRGRVYTPYKKNPKYTGFLALYAHYIYLLGKIKKQQYPPRMTPHLKAEVLKFDKYKAQFELLRKHNISTPEQLTTYVKGSQERITALLKQRTIMNVKKKKRKRLFDALATIEALRPVTSLYAEGVTGIENEFAQYMDAANTLEKSGVAREALIKEKVETYAAIAEVNREIRDTRKDLAMLEEILRSVPEMEKDITQQAEPKHTRKKQQQKEQ